MTRPIRTAAAMAMAMAMAGTALLSHAQETAPAGGEPAADSKPPTAESAASKIERIDADTYRLGNITFDRETRVITFPAWINMREGLLEYAIVSGHGKLHESLLACDVSPFELNVVLLLLRCKPDRSLVNPLVPDEEQVPPDPNRAEGAALVVEITPIQEDGSAGKPARLESWIRSLVHDAAASAGTWTYTGSTIAGGHFGAEVDGSILALYLDPRALINNPRDGNLDDEAWVAAEAVPEVGAKVTVSLRPADPK